MFFKKLSSACQLNVIALVLITLLGFFEPSLNGAWYYCLFIAIIQVTITATLNLSYAAFPVMWDRVHSTDTDKSLVLKIYPDIKYWKDWWKA